MKGKIAKLAGLLVALALMAGPTAYSIYQNSDTFTPAVQATDIIGPETAVVGEMIRLSVQGDQVEWKCLPENKNIQVYGDRNENLVASFEQPGVYTFFAAIVKEGKLKATLIQITVTGGGAVVTVPTTPTVPGVPTPQLPAVTGKLSADVTAWCTADEVDKEVATQLASNFEMVASEISLGKLKTSDEIIRRTLELNSTLDLEDFSTVIGQVQAYLTSEADAGRLVSPEQHTQVWSQIATGLKAYAS